MTSGTARPVSPARTSEKLLFAVISPVRQELALISIVSAEINQIECHIWHLQRHVTLSRLQAGWELPGGEPVPAWCAGREGQSCRSPIRATYANGCCWRASAAG